MGEVGRPSTGAVFWSSRLFYRSTALFPTALAKRGGWREDRADEGRGELRLGAGRELGFRTGGWREDPADEESADGGE